MYSRVPFLCLNGSAQGLGEEDEKAELSETCDEEPPISGGALRSIGGFATTRIETM